MLNSNQSSRHLMNSFIMVHNINSMILSDHFSLYVLRQKSFVVVNNCSFFIIIIVYKIIEY